MIIYESTKEGFLKDAANGIEDDIQARVLAFMHRNVRPGSPEYESWKNSLGNAMYHVMNSDKIPDDAGVGIEYNIPSSNRRIDFLVTGFDDIGHSNAVIIELKQWSKIAATDMDGIVETYISRSLRDKEHPSYQAWSYAALLKGFNVAVYDGDIDLAPCAYLHNHVDQGIVTGAFYKDYLDRAPSFCKGDKEKLQDFIATFVRRGDRGKTLFLIENSEIRPSKHLADTIASLLKGNKEFIMIDDQKVVYEKAISLTKKASAKKKQVLIVEGGPGTGKSVVALNLLTDITKLGLNTRYVTKNAAPRDVFEAKLTGDFKKSEISNMFTGSGSFTSATPNVFDALVVDEAHRLNEKSGMYRNLGENQIKEIIDAAKCCVFFIDEDQRIAWNDIGQIDEIERWAKSAGAVITKMELQSQFRCNGSDGYLEWLDNTLQIKETANPTLEGIDYDFRVVESPNELRDLIFEKNVEANKARIVAGYCWNWISKRNPAALDIQISEHEFAMRWNLNSESTKWIIKPDSVSEIGCIHTSQGLEVDYIGVIVGPDLVAHNGEVKTDPSKRAKSDASLNGYKKLRADHPVVADKKADALIRNTYKTLMTRGLKGCYVYCVDKETQDYFKKMMGNGPRRIAQPALEVKAP